MDHYEIGKCHGHTHGSLIDELFCHFPYAIFSVSLGLIVLSLFEFFGITRASQELTEKSAHVLFHSFHFIHMVFAASGALITFSRYSKNLFKGFIVALLTAIIFCTLSDVILPYIAGRFLGVPIHLHLCLFNELDNIVPFLSIGLLNGLVIIKNGIPSRLVTVGMHMGHILAGSLAALFYLVSEGFSHWHPHMGALFLLLIVAVVIPCTLADIVVPMFIAGRQKR
jgi:hypothetical protein